MSTVAANLVSKSEVSNLSISLTPLEPSIMFFHEEVTLLPTGDNIPRPVTTTLL